MIPAQPIEGPKTVMEKVGPNIISHVSNSSKGDHSIIEFPFKILGIDFSVTKHVLMLWLVAFLLSVLVIVPVRKFLNSGKLIPSGWVNAIEAIVKFIRDSIVRPNVGDKWVMTWTPIILTFFFFILFANGIGMIPIFDLLGVINRFIIGVPYADEHNIINRMLHGGVTATGNFNVSGALAVITFFFLL